MDSCRICASRADHPTYVAREMMFGLRDEFAYFQCQRCECLQIRDMPGDMRPYYPGNYYSMQTALPQASATKRALWGAEARVRRYVANRVFGSSRRTRIFDWMRGTRSRFDSAILDVGCGRGKLLHELRMFGYRDLTGADPFVSEPSEEQGIKIHKAELNQLDSKFDLIMMHHTFEHVPDPTGTIGAAAARLDSGSYLLLRIPVVDSFAWRHYGVNWFALDAPRHFYLHSQKSVQLLAEGAGFSVEKIEYDSGAHQFWGSEQYLRDIPHRSANSHEDNTNGSVFSAEQLREFEQKSRELNAQHAGDSACFYLRRN
jgi:SAM-dependent methyltransferase